MNTFYDLLKEVEENRYLGIIYPSLKDIELELSKFYNDKINKLIEALEYKKSGSSDCSSFE
ncbi:MAG: hypothetical protein RBS82_09600 [Syntrophales bacterium]|jgi:hypothetical protein|nr:hypothetical protein [Syntrophales bacterium]